MVMKKPSKRSCTVCPKNKESKEDLDDLYDPTNPNEVQDHNKTKQSQQPKSNYNRNKSKYRKNKNRNNHYKHPNRPHFRPAFISPHQHPNNQINRPPPLKSYNQYYGIEISEVISPMNGDTFTNTLIGEKYLYNKGIWNLLPSPIIGSRAYYSEYENQLITNPNEGDLMIHGNLISVFQNNQWNSFGTRNQHKSFPKIKPIAAQETDIPKLSTNSFKLIQIKENKENTKIENKENENENKENQSENRNENKENRNENKENQNENRNENKENQNENKENQNENKESHNKGNEYLLEGTYVSDTTISNEQTPTLLEGTFKIPVYSHGYVSIKLTSENSPMNRVEFGLASWIKYSDANKGIWQTVICLADLQLYDGMGVQITEYQVNGDQVVDLKQLHKTITTTSQLDRVLLSVPDEYPIHKITFKCKLLAYQAQQEQPEFFAVQFNEFKKDIDYPIFECKILP